MSAIRPSVSARTGCRTGRPGSPCLLSRSAIAGMVLSAAAATALVSTGLDAQEATSLLDTSFSTTELDRMCRVPAHRLNVQLMWENRDMADLDLHAMRPDGTHISYRARGTQRCEGVLDHDRLRDSVFTTPETFFVQQEGCPSAPQGEFRIWVQYFGGRLREVPFTLTVRLGDSVQFTCRGVVSLARSRRLSQAIRLPADAAAVETGQVSLPAWCG